MEKKDEQAPAGAKLSVRHRTVFHYSSPVWNSINTLHLEPRTFPFQKTLAATIRIAPETRVLRFADLFQNITHHFELGGDHTRLEIESSIQVHNLPLRLSAEGLSSGMEGFGNPLIRENLWQYLQESGRVTTPPQIWKKAVDLTLEVAPVYEKALAIMRWIHFDFSHDAVTTDTHAPAEAVFSRKKGGSADLTHVMLSLCRSVGIPSRFASGYLFSAPGDKPGGAQESHAWCEAYLPEAGWIGFDPSNGRLADERYVKIAVGRDHGDVAPLRSSYHGSANCKTETEVLVERL